MDAQCLEGIHPFSPKPLNQARTSKGSFSGGLTASAATPTGRKQTRSYSLGTPRISAICQGKRAVGADTAARLARFFGTTAAFWLGLQGDYDTEEVERNLSAELKKIHPWRMAA